MQALEWLPKKEKHTIRIGIVYLINPKKIITDKKDKGIVASLRFKTVTTYINRGIYSEN